MQNKRPMRYISDSQRTTSSCEHKWFLRYGLRLVEPSKGERMYFGILWSEIMERFGDLFTYERIQSVNDWLDGAEQKHIDSRGPDMMVDVQDTRRVFDEVRGLFFRYVENYRDKNRLGDVILGNEMSIKAPVVTPKGHASSRSGWIGYLDKLVELNGALWVVDHKTTRTSIEDWRQANAHKPQGVTYCWLVQQALPGREVRGIVYDVALSKPPKPSSDFTPIKNGSRLSKPHGVPWTTAQNWLEAIDAHGFSLGDEPYYREVLEALVARERSGFWFGRIVIPVTQRQIDRVGDELYAEATRVRRLHDRVREIRRELNDVNDKGSPHLLAQEVARLSETYGGRYPRNSSMCNLYHRACEYTSLCTEQSVEAASRYAVSERRKKEPKLTASYSTEVE